MEMLPKEPVPLLDHNGAFIGSYDEATHTFTKRENVQLMDGGIDFYATQTCRPGWPPPS